MLDINKLDRHIYYGPDSRFYSFPHLCGDKLSDFVFAIIIKWHGKLTPAECN